MHELGLNQIQAYHARNALLISFVITLQQGYMPFTRTQEPWGLSCGQSTSQVPTQYAYLGVLRRKPYVLRALTLFDTALKQP